METEEKVEKNRKSCRFPCVFQVSLYRLFLALLRRSRSSVNALSLCTPSSFTKVLPTEFVIVFGSKTVFECAGEVRELFKTAANAKCDEKSRLLTNSRSYSQQIHMMIINNNMNRAQDDIVGGGRWTPTEHMLFIEGFKMFGKDWKRISKVVETRSNIQCRTHGQKYFRSHPQELALLLAIKKQNSQLPVVSEPPQQVPYFPSQQLQQPVYYSAQDQFPMLDARFVAYLKQRVNQVPGPLFMPFM